MEKQFIVERSGKSFVLYAGLLAEAHAQGLQSITTELVQIPSEANNRVAICTATVTMAIGEQSKVFTGIADAAPNNVAPAMQSCLIRMSETRAKARALRDAINVGMCSLEELGDDDDNAYHTSNNTYQEKPAQNRATSHAQAAKPELRVVQQPQEDPDEKAWQSFIAACAAVGFKSDNSQDYINVAEDLCKKSPKPLETDAAFYTFAAACNSIDLECAIHDVKTRKQGQTTKAVIG